MISWHLTSIMGRAQWQRQYIQMHLAIPYGQITNRVWFTKGSGIKSLANNWSMDHRADEPRLHKHCSITEAVLMRYSINSTRKLSGLRYLYSTNRMNYRNTQEIQSSMSSLCGPSITREMGGNKYHQAHYSITPAQPNRVNIKLRKFPS